MRVFRGVAAATPFVGVSAEGGVPTFRDAQTGLWAKFSPEELASPRAFRRAPRLVWEWYEWTFLVRFSFEAPKLRDQRRSELLTPLCRERHWRLYAG